MEAGGRGEDVSSTGSLYKCLFIPEGRNFHPVLSYGRQQSKYLAHCLLPLRYPHRNQESGIRNQERGKRVAGMGTGTLLQDAGIPNCTTLIIIFSYPKAHNLTAAQAFVGDRCKDVTAIQPVEQSGSAMCHFQDKGEKITFLKEQGTQ